MSVVAYLESVLPSTMAAPLATALAAPPMPRQLERQFSGPTDKLTGRPPRPSAQPARGDFETEPGLALRQEALAQVPDCFVLALSPTQRTSLWHGCHCVLQHLLLSCFGQLAALRGDPSQDAPGRTWPSRSPVGDPAARRVPYWAALVLKGACQSR